MKREIWKSDQPVLSNDLDRAQSSKEDAITDRFGDSFDYGIVPDSQLFAETEPLEITLSLSPFEFDVASGIAYDADGERIVVDDPALIYSASGPSTTTDNGIGGTSLTPQTTGCVSIPLSPGVVNYLYITYLERVDPDVFTLRETTNERLFIKGDDSYRIDVVTDVGPAVGNPDVFKPFLSSLCIGIVDTLQVLDLTPRKYFTLKSGSLSVDVPTALNTLQALGEPYIMGQSITFTDHVSAIGTGVVSATNPHGLSINDITGVFSGKTAEQHEKLFHESGISGDQTSITSALFGRPEDSAGSPFIGPTYARDTFLIKKLLPSGTQNFNGNNSQQLFTLAGGLTFNPGSGNLRVFLNGVLQLSPAQYTEVGNNAVNFVTPPALGVPIALVVDGEAVQVNGITISSSQISEDYLIYFVDPTGVFLDNGVYTAYLDASIGAIRLAYNGTPVNKNYRVYGVTTGTFTNLVALPIATVAANANNLLLWQVTWDSSGFGLGNDNFILVTDQRIFGTIGSDALARDSATDTVTINHNLWVNGNETVTGTLSVGTLLLEAGIPIIPPGTVLSWAGKTPSIPTGWIICDGTEYPNATYPYLYAAIGENWGSSSVGVTFKVPDLRGQFLRGADLGAGIDPDVSIRSVVTGSPVSQDRAGTKQSDDFKDHQHHYDQPGGGTSSGGNPNSIAINYGQLTYTTTNLVTGNETRPKNAYVIFIIKAF